MKQNEKQQPHSEWTMNNKYFHSTKSKLYESKSHPQEVYYLNSESLSPKEALWTVQLHIKNCHKYTQHTDTHTNTIGQHFGNVIMKVVQKTITEPESIKLSKTLHDQDLVEQAYSLKGPTFRRMWVIWHRRATVCFPCVMAHKWKRRKLGKISGRWKTYQISHNGATDSSMYL